MRQQEVVPTTHTTMMMMRTEVVKGVLPVLSAVELMFCCCAGGEGGGGADTLDPNVDVVVAAATGEDNATPVHAVRPALCSVDTRTVGLIAVMVAANALAEFAVDA